MGDSLTGSRVKENGRCSYHYQEGCKERIRADNADREFVVWLNSLPVLQEIASLNLNPAIALLQRKNGDFEQKKKD